MACGDIPSRYPCHINACISVGSPLGHPTMPQTPQSLTQTSGVLYCIESLPCKNFWELRDTLFSGCIRLRLLLYLHSTAVLLQFVTGWAQKATNKAIPKRNSWTVKLASPRPTSLQPSATKRKAKQQCSSREAQGDSTAYIP